MDEFPDVERDYAYVDALSMYLVQRPRDYDVLVAENMYGDIISDLAAGLVGGLGMAPSGDIGPDAAVFQPSPACSSILRVEDWLIPSL